ncbi:MAG: cytochrome C oxidase subunit IV family protein [Wenzhouxiangellaceae bacterium]|nr:cytochrome C oxidase subunit IV family protein [Wenzhouxiangellaceae bacterium]
MTQEDAQTHSLAIYFWVWGWLFVLSVGSYLTDVITMHDYLKWTLITMFMFAKAGLIMAVFMHMVWERLSLTMVILAPPGVLLVAIAIFALEAEYTISSRLQYFLAS